MEQLDKIITKLKSLQAIPDKYFAAKSNELLACAIELAEYLKHVRDSASSAVKKLELINRLNEKLKSEVLVTVEGNKFNTSDLFVYDTDLRTINNCHYTTPSGKKLLLHKNEIVCTFEPEEFDYNLTYAFVLDFKSVIKWE